MRTIVEARPAAEQTVPATQAIIGASAAHAYAARLATQLVADRTIAGTSVADLTLVDFRLLQAAVIECELSQLALDPKAFVVMRAEAQLVDLGGRAGLSERAADELDRIAETLRPGRRTASTPAI
jgi:hypothetical protein